MNIYASASRPQQSPHRKRLCIKEHVPTDNRKVPVPERDDRMAYKFDTLKTKSNLVHKYNPVKLKDYISPNYAHGKTLTHPTLVPNTYGKIYQLKLKL